MNFGLYAPNSGRVINAELKIVIADITLTNSGSFESIPIPAGLDGIEIVVRLRSTAAVTADTPYLILNGDTTAANYSVQQLTGTGTSVSTSRVDVPSIGSVAGASSTAGDYGAITVIMRNITAAGMRREGYAISSDRRDATTQVARLHSYNWESTEPITSITIRTDNHATDLFAAGSRVQVFGLGTFAVALAR